MSFEKKVYLSISPIVNDKREAIGFNVDQVYKVRPITPNSIILEVVLRLPESMISPSVVADLTTEQLEAQAEDLLKIHRSL